MQTQDLHDEPNKDPTYTSIGDAVIKAAKNQGFFSLWRGN